MNLEDEIKRIADEIQEKAQDAAHAYQTEQEFELFMAATKDRPEIRQALADELGIDW